MKRDKGTEAAARPVENGKTGAGAGASRRQHATKRDYNKEQLIACCKRSNGIMSCVATLMGVSWHTAERYVKSCPEAEEAFQGARNAVIDAAESDLLAILTNNKHPRHFDAVVFTLKTLGKNRGFTEKVETEVSGDLKPPPVLNILIEKSPKGTKSSAAQGGGTGN